MNILLFLIPLALLLLLVAIAFFVWSVRSGQWDDLDAPALDILCDSAPASESKGADDADA